MTHVKVRHSHSLVFVLRLRVENKMRHSAIACDKGVKETGSSQLPTTWIKKESKVLQKMIR